MKRLILVMPLLCLVSVFLSACAEEPVATQTTTTTRETTVTQPTSATTTTTHSTGY